MIGYVYVMLNPAFPNLIKIGRTLRNSQDRATELYTTGTPERFVVLYEVLVDDCIEVEALLHDYFSDSRYNNNREFFEVTPSKAINKIQELCKSRIVNHITNENLHNITQQAKISKCSLYMVFIGNINYNSHAEIELERAGNSGKLYRIGLYERTSTPDLNVEVDIEDEKTVEIELSDILWKYYSKLSNHNYYEYPIKFLKLKSFECPEGLISELRLKIEDSVKSFLVKDENKSNSEFGWRCKYDGQTLIHTPFAYNINGACSVYSDVDRLIEEFLVRLNKTLKDRKEAELLEVLRTEFKRNF